MNATDFCNFFDFTIVKEHGYNDDEEYNYIGIDDWGVFQNRYSEDIEGISEWFDSMLKDYIDDDIEENGFTHVNNATYYDEALQWAIDNKHDCYIPVLNALVNPETLVDDL